MRLEINNDDTGTDRRISAGVRITGARREPFAFSRSKVHMRPSNCCSQVAIVKHGEMMAVCLSHEYLRLMFAFCISIGVCGVSLNQSTIF